MHFVGSGQRFIRTTQVGSDVPPSEQKARQQHPEKRVAICFRIMHREYFYVYIMSNRSRTLYTGYTNNLQKRVWQHKNHIYEGFTDRYQCDHLVYYEQLSTPEGGINREKQIKGWKRVRKVALIVAQNPTWRDLSDDWGKPAQMRWCAAKCIDPSLRSG